MSIIYIDSNDDLVNFQLRKLMKEHVEYQKKYHQEKELKLQYQTLRDCYYQFQKIGKMDKELEALYWKYEKLYYNFNL